MSTISPILQLKLNKKLSFSAGIGETATTFQKRAHFSEVVKMNTLSPMLQSKLNKTLSILANI